MAISKRNTKPAKTTEPAADLLQEIHVQALEVSTMINAICRLTIESEDREITILARQGKRWRTSWQTTSIGSL